MKGEHFFTFNDRKVTYLQTSQKTDYICRVIVRKLPILGYPLLDGRQSAPV